MQQVDRASKVAGLRDEAQGLGEAAQFALQQGATLAEAKLIERQAKYESIKMNLEQIAMRSNNQQLQMRAQEMIAGLAAKDAQLAGQGLEMSAMEANNLNTARAANARLAQQKAELGIKVGAAGAGGGDKMNPGLIERATAASAAYDSLPALEKAIGSGKLGDALLDELAKRVPGTDAANRDQQAQLLGRIIFAGIDKSVVNAADQEFLGKLQSGVGLRSMSRGDLPAFKRLIEASYNGARRIALLNGMVDIGPLPTYGGAGQRALSTERPVQ